MINFKVLLILYLIQIFITTKNNNMQRIDEPPLYHLDKVLTYQFTFQKNISIFPNFKDFLANNKGLHQDIAKHIIKMIQEVSSISFDLYVSEKCTKYQAFNYASKNLLQNIKYICSQLSNQIRKIGQIQHQRQRQIQRKKQIQIKFDNLMENIINFVCLQVQTVVSQIFAKYPKTLKSGYSQKLKKKIKKIDYRQDYKLETLFLNKLVITETNKEKLLIKIMEFLNIVIETPQKYESSFNEFNYHLAWISFQSLITEQQIDHPQKSIKFIEFLIDPNEENKKQLQNFVKKGQQIVSLIQKNIQSIKNEGRVLVNAKIPKTTMPYKDELKNGDFKIKSSPLLRVITKWTEDIDDTLKNSQKYIRDNYFHFKDNDNNHIQLSDFQRRVLYDQIKDIYEELKEAKKKQTNYLVYDALEQQNFTKINYYFQESLRLSSMLNSYIIKKTVKQLIQRLQKLLQIPKKAAKQFELRYLVEKSKNMNAPKDQRQRNQKENKQKLKKQRSQLQSLNLICNRVGDLLRGSIYCSNEKQFIKLVALLYSLDRHCQTHKILVQKEEVAFFKLIRIKDNLDKPINNVLINYIFKGKIQCELQIYFLVKDKSLEKDAAMHHFFYELIRGRFGIISQLANIVNQNDPITLYHRKTNLVLRKYPKQYQPVVLFEKRTRTAKSQRAQPRQIWRCINKNCNKLSLDGYHKFIKKLNEDGSEYFECMDCYFIDLPNPHYPVDNVLTKLDLLNQLEYEASDDRLIHKLLDRENRQNVKLLSQNISKRSKDSQILCLLITPTDKKVLVQLLNIYYSQILYSFVMVSLQLQKTRLIQYNNEQIIEDLQNNQKFYVQIKKTRTIQLFFQDHQNYKKQIFIDNIMECKKQAFYKYNINFFKECVTNKQPNPKLNNRQEIAAELEKQIKQMVFVQSLYAQNIGVKNINLYNQLAKVKELVLSDNKLAESIKIADYKQLTYLDLSYNEIKSIRFKNVQKLKCILLNNNQLNLFRFDDLKQLEKLNLQRNQFQKTLFLQDLDSLTHLNINYNNVATLQIQNSSKITKLYCKKRKQVHSSMEINFHPQARLKQLVSLENIISNEKIKYHLFTELIIEIDQTNYLILNNHFQSLSNLSLHFLNIHQEGFEQQLSLFVIRHKKVSDMEFKFKNCQIKSLDLSKVNYNIQRLTLFQQSKCLKELKLNSVTKLFFMASLEKLEIIKWENLKHFTANQTNLINCQIDPFGKANFDVQQMNVDFLKTYKFNNLKSAEQLDLTFKLKNQQKSLQFTNNQKLKQLSLQLQIDQQLLQKLQKEQKNNNPIIMEKLQIKQCKQLQQLKITFQYDKKIEVAQLNVPNLRHFQLQCVLIGTLDLTVSDKIKKMYFKALVQIENIVFNVQDKKQIILQELYLNSHIAKLNQLHYKLKAVSKVNFCFYKYQQNFTINTSHICREIKQLRFTVYNDQEQIEQTGNLIDIQIKIIVDSLVTILYLPINATNILLEISNYCNGLLYIREDNEKFMNLEQLQIANPQKVKIIFQISTERMKIYENLLKQAGPGTMIRDLQQRIY